MTMTMLNETKAARAALESAWTDLARVAERARRARADSNGMADPRSLALITWADEFEAEMAAIQRVYEAGDQLPIDDIRAATGAAEKLLAILADAEQRAAPMLQPAQALAGE